MGRRFYFSLAAAGLILDQATKLLILTYFSDFTVVEVIPGFFRLIRTENTGMAFSFLSDVSSPWVMALLIVFSAAAVVFVSVLLWRLEAGQARLGVGLGLILGGAAGNLIDRIAYGHVIDFLDFYVGRHHWPAFNVADSLILIGAVALILDLWAEQPAERPTA